ncbi:adhesin [Rudanella paleaurantiibacter]|uniref:Adhesin n=1 Tax=Rudanella paleaurantiibacter TaxID=2614655 RepID=A0A7J5TTH7_9BACT|nr:adhesin [Rudanella paleaurantiibacter]KAB7727069.1 adhesin [Rudanella paleaurantiibacter]
MNYQLNTEEILATAPEQGGAPYDDLGSGSTAGYGATDADAVGRGDDMDDDELLDEEDDDNTDPLGDEMEEDFDNDTTSTGRSDY